MQNYLLDTDCDFLKNLQSKLEQQIINGNYQFYYSLDCFDKLKKLALKYNFYILQNDFEETLRKEGYSHLFQEAKSLMGKNKSKVILGRYVAEKIVEKEKKIPEEFVEIINLAISKSRIV